MICPEAGGVEAIPAALALRLKLLLSFEASEFHKIQELNWRSFLGQCVAHTIFPATLLNWMKMNWYLSGQGLFCLVRHVAIRVSIQWILSILEALCPVTSSVANLPVTCWCNAGGSVPDKSVVGRSTF